jgi:hypothetical protein
MPPPGMENGCTSLWPPCLNQGFSLEKNNNLQKAYLRLYYISLFYRGGTLQRRDVHRDHTNGL